MKILFFEVKIEVTTNYNYFQIANKNLNRITTFERIIIVFGAFNDGMHLLRVTLIQKQRKGSKGGGKGRGRVDSGVHQSGKMSC